MAPRISRHGLVECTSCQTHIRGDELRCPFCGVARNELDRRMLSALKDLFGARGGAMATSLVSLGIAVGCSSTPVPLYGIAPLDSGAPTQDAAAQDAAPQDATASDAAGPDVGLGPMYGMPPVDAGVPPDTGLSPHYGAPPIDAGTEPDAAGQDVTIGPLYGLPPVDAGH
jgi:hypothetical protein